MLTRATEENYKNNSSAREGKVCVQKVVSRPWEHYIGSRSRSLLEAPR